MTGVLLSLFISRIIRYYVRDSTCSVEQFEILTFLIVYSSFLDLNRRGMACSPASCYSFTVVVSVKEYTDARCVSLTVHLMAWMFLGGLPPIVSNHVRMAWGWDVVFCVVAALRDVKMTKGTKTTYAVDDVRILGVLIAELCRRRSRHSHCTASMSV